MLGIDAVRQRSDLGLERAKELRVRSVELERRVGFPRRRLQDTNSDLVGQATERHVLVVERLATRIEERLPDGDA